MIQEPQFTLGTGTTGGLLLRWTGLLALLGIPVISIWSHGGPWEAAASFFGSIALIFTFGYWMEYRAANTVRIEGERLLVLECPVGEFVWGLPEIELARPIWLRALQNGGFIARHRVSGRRVFILGDRKQLDKLLSYLDSLGLRVGI